MIRPRQRHHRHRRHAQPRLDQTDHGRHMLGFADALTLRHHRAQGLIEQKPVARSLVQRDVILLIELVPRHAITPGQRVIAAAGDHVALLHKRFEIDFGILRAHETQTEIRLAIDHGAQYIVGAGIEDFDFDAWKLLVIARDHAGHEVVRRRGYAGDGDVAQSGRGDFADAEQCHVQIIEQPFHAGHEAASGLGQADLARGALEQLHAEGLFELFNTSAQRRL